MIAIDLSRNGKTVIPTVKFVGDSAYDQQDLAILLFLLRQGAYASLLLEKLKTSLTDQQYLQLVLLFKEMCKNHEELRADVRGVNEADLAFKPLIDVVAKNDSQKNIR